MAAGHGRHVLPVLYLVLVTAVCGLLALFGYVIDRLPLLPASVPRGYQRLMFATIFGLSGPVDTWTGGPSDGVGGGVTDDPTP